MKTAKIMNCGFHIVNRIMHRSVKRGLSRRYLHIVPCEHISIDEKSFKKRHQYVTVVSYPLSGVVLNVGQHRNEDAIL